jgi:hypothetical protein
MSEAAEKRSATVRLKDRVALVTGGDRGLGLGIARAFALGAASASPTPTPKIGTRPNSSHQNNTLGNSSTDLGPKRGNRSAALSRRPDYRTCLVFFSICANLRHLRIDPENLSHLLRFSRLKTS